MNTEYQKKVQKEKIGKLSRDLRHWKSQLYFMKDEILFIERLLNSYVFEPNTPNLFERLQGYLGQIQGTKKSGQDVLASISKYEKDLGGMMECRDADCDYTYYSKHQQIKSELTTCLLDFRTLKSEIFNYAGGILKKKKPSRKN